MYLLDTNAISEMRKAKQGKASPSFVQWADSVGDATLCTCAVVMMELERGVLGMERKDPAQGLHLRRWLDGTIKPLFAGCILPIDEDTVAICARLHVPDRSPENDALDCRHCHPAPSDHRYPQRGGLRRKRGEAVKSF